LIARALFQCGFNNFAQAFREDFRAPYQVRPQRALFRTHLIPGHNKGNQRDSGHQEQDQPKAKFHVTTPRSFLLSSEGRGRLGVSRPFQYTLYHFDWHKKRESHHSSHSWNSANPTQPVEHPTG
jgi:hypothetical protein